MNALQGLGLPTLDKNETAIHLPPEPSSIYPSYQHGLLPPQPANILPSPNFTNRPYTSSSLEYRPSGSEYRPLSSAHDIRSERPYTAPQPVSFSQTLPPERGLPSQMQLFTSNMTTASKMSESLMFGTVGSKQLSAKPSAKEKAQAETTKSKTTRNVTPSRLIETHFESASLLSPSPSEARKKRAQAKRGEPLNPATISDILQSPNFDPAADEAEAPLLASAKCTDPVQRPIEDGPDTATAAGESSANDRVPSKSITDTSGGSTLVLRPGRQAMAKITGNSPGLNSNHPASASTAEPAIPKPVSSPNAEEVSAEEFMSELDKFIRDYHHLPTPEPQPTAADDLAAYAAQPDEVRKAIVKDMIVNFLEDENFIKLAEDMSKEWRRIGLGL